MIHRPSRRTLIVTAAVLAAGAAAGALLLSLSTPQQDRGTAAAIGAGLGLIISAGFATYLPLARHLGRLTAVAALSVTISALLGTVAALVPDCPGTQGRCPGTEIGSWMLSGAMLPIAWALLILPAVMLIRTAVTGTRWVRRRSTGTHPGTGTPARSVPKTTRATKTRTTAKNRPPRHHRRAATATTGR